MFLQTLIVMYQDVTKLPISDENKEKFQEFIKYKTIEYIPIPGLTVDDPILEDILSTELV